MLGMGYQLLVKDRQMVSSGFEDIIEQCKTSLAEVTKKSLMSLKRNQWVESFAEEDATEGDRRW